MPDPSQALSKTSDDEVKRKSARNQRLPSMRRPPPTNLLKDGRNSIAFASTRMLQLDRHDNSDSSLNMSGFSLENIPVVSRNNSYATMTSSRNFDASASSLDGSKLQLRSPRRSQTSELRLEMSQTRISKVHDDEQTINPHLLCSPSVRKIKKRIVSKSPSTMEKKTLEETVWKRNGNRKRTSPPPPPKSNAALQNHLESEKKKPGVRKGGSMRNILRNKRRLEKELHRSDIFHFVLYKAVPNGKKDQTCPIDHDRSRRRRMSLDKFLCMKRNSECLVLHNDTTSRQGQTEESGTWQMAADLSRSARLLPVEHKEEEEKEEDYEDASVVSLDVWEAINDQKESKLIPHESGDTAMSEELESQSLSLDIGDLQLEDDCSGQSSDRKVRHVKEYPVVDPAGNKGIYSGMISKSSGMPCGHGKLEYLETGVIYEGQFVHGYWGGTGRCIYTRTGEDYTGTFLDNIRHGHGITKYLDGRVFEGTYTDGVKTEGKMTYQDGSTYLGHWSNGARHGRGTYTFANGSVFIGEFENDHMHGSGVLTWSNGLRYVGSWKNGRRHGPGKEFHPNGTIRKDGSWNEGTFLQQR